MRNYKLFPVWVLMVFLFFGCDVPKAPNFTTSQKVEAPLLVNKTFQFMGGGGTTEVLIDTTTSEFDSLFTVDGDGFISLSREENFEFGDLNDAVPTISTDPTSFNAQVGELSLGSFSSSQGNLGEANFQDLTNLDPSVISTGDPVPPQAVSPEVTIDLATDFFTSATFKGGSLEIVLENNLGFDLDNITVTLVSDPVPGSSGDEIDVVTGNTGFLSDNTQGTISLPFNAGDQLANPQIRVSISWTSSLVPGNPDRQVFQRPPESLVVISAEGNNLVASEVVAAVEGQDFSTTNTSSFDATEFQFTDPSHFVELESGQIVIEPISNDLELAVETLTISFPDILAPPYTSSDALVINYTSGIPAASGGTPGLSVAQNIDLAGYRLYALNNEVNYTISAITENTQNAPPGEQNRTISETQEISSSVEINNLGIARAFGLIASQEVVLGDDDPANGTDVLDLFNETETELTEIDGLEDLSKEIDGLEFTQATLTINYTTNIGVPTVIYGAFLGINGEGEEIYLKGLPGNDTYVSQPVAGLQANGVPIPSDSLIRFEIQPSVSGGTESFSVTFDQSNSGVTTFLNNLPSEIRFIGKAFVNESGGEASISTPLEFDPGISVNLPLALRTTNAASITDTTETTDLQDLPREGQKTIISEGSLFLNYSNALPLGFSIKLRFLEDDFTEFLTLPAGADEFYDLNGSSVDPVTFFTDTPTDGSLPITLTEDQLNQLYRTSYVVIEAQLRTSDNNEVRLRAQDTITLSIAARLSIENIID